MKKGILVVVGILVLLFAANAFAYDINDVIGDRIGERRFELYGLNFNRNEQTQIATFDIFSNYPGSLTVGGWNTFAADLALDFDRDGNYEFGVAFTDHDGLTAGNVYSVSSWHLSDFYEPPGGGYGYNHNQIVTIDGHGPLITSGALNWLGDVGDPDYRINLVLDTQGWELPPGWDGYFNVFYGGATCANDYLGGTLRVVPEPISAALFLLGGGALAVRQYRKKKQIA